jgi:hypothetical protein
LSYCTQKLEPEPSAYGNLNEADTVSASLKVEIVGRLRAEVDSLVDITGTGKTVVISKSMVPLMAEFPLLQSHRSVSGPLILTIVDVTQRRARGKVQCIC